LKYTNEVSAKRRLSQGVSFGQIFHPQRSIYSLALATLLAQAVHGQSFTASVRGTVTDESGAAVPAARIVVTDSDRGTSFRGEADSAGRYTVTALPPGNYILIVDATGLKKFSSGRFTVAVQQQTTVDARLQVGDVNTTVEVTGSASLLNTTISNLGQVIDNQTILKLPNIARNSMGLV